MGAMTTVQQEDLFRAAKEAHAKRDFATAGSLYARFVKLNPGSPEGWENLGVLLGEIGDYAEAENCLRGVLRFLPDWPKRFRLHAHLCWILSLQGRADAAIAEGREAVRLDPEYEGGRINLAGALLMAAKHDEAIASYEDAAALGSARYHAGLYAAKRSVCDWEGIEALERVLLDPAYENKEFTLALLIAASTPQAQLALAETFAKRYPARYIHSLGERRQVVNRKIKLGYLSGEFHDTSTMSLVTRTIENHDRDRFELHAFSFGPDSSGPTRQRLKGAFAHFHELGGKPNELVARSIAAADLDILLDLSGYVRPDRVGIVARRPAPIQISYLGWPATMGAPFIDYIVADPVVAPDQAAFSERLLHLDCYMPTDDSRPEPRRRERGEFGLPSEAIVLSSMNGPWKLTQAIMALWCEILRELPEAVLLQTVPDAQAERRLRAFARDQGVGERLLVAARIDYENHIDRLALTDLGLDSFPYGGHTTTCDTLWAGVPVVTCRGGTFASRVATSLLGAVGMPELSTAGLAEYKVLILALCRDRPRLERLKAQLNGARRSCKLFDNAAYTRGLEMRLIERVA
jgi:protein O-GlcNAc transferase